MSTTESMLGQHSPRFTCPHERTYPKQPVHHAELSPWAIQLDHCQFTHAHQVCGKWKKQSLLQLCPGWMYHHILCIQNTWKPCSRVRHLLEFVNRIVVALSALPLIFSSKTSVDVHANNKWQHKWCLESGAALTCLTSWWVNSPLPHKQRIMHIPNALASPCHTHKHPQISTPHTPHNCTTNTQLHLNPNRNKMTGH